MDEDALSRGNPVEQLAVDIGVRGRIVFDQIAAAFDGYRVLCAGHLQADFHVHGHRRNGRRHPAHRRENPLAVTAEVVRIERHVGEAESAGASVVVDRSNPLTGLWMVTVAFGTMAPDGSVTVPSIAGRVSAGLGRGSRLRMQTRRKQTAILLEMLSRISFFLPV